MTPTDKRIHFVALGQHTRMHFFSSVGKNYTKLTTWMERLTSQPSTHCTLRSRIPSYTAPRLAIFKRQTQLQLLQPPPTIMAQPPVPDPPHTGKRRSTRLSRADASHVDAPVPSHGPTEDEAEESPTEKQRSGTTKTKLGRKAKDTSTAVELTPNTPTLKAPREPNIELSPATVNSNNFYTLLPKLSINPTA